ncbi:MULTISPECIES: MDR family MFS transporter [unclassified Sphingomonas]|uniref:MDR family MFS transporter n=1 Tax=unclassified Sphingomonas TaxID=196159 RepID=UPI00226AB899|nr:MULTISPECIES: MDR family MFS transporter [unclassified Sphingomonas]
MHISQSHARPLVLASVMAASFMIAIEATIVSTAMPQIVGHLGRLELYAWVFSSFLLAQTATTVVFGKLADLYGRKSVLLVGIAIFLVGSLLCGGAWSMPSLIAFRLVQGVGAGAIQPVSITVIGDQYAAHERGRVQGYLASVWGVSSVIGPLAGGLIIQHLSWAWIFWINVPVGLTAAAGFHFFLKETVSREKRDVDVAGAVLFTVTIAALMLALTEAGDAGSRTSLVAAAICLVAGVLFVGQERRARDPMMAFGLWSRRPIATTNAATLLSGMAVIGLTTFLPMYVQAVLGYSALVAGFTLTAMVLGWPIGATLAARNFARFGLRPTLVFGGALLPVGAVAFVVLAPAMSPWVAGVGSLVMGFGMGFLSTAAIVIIQDSVGWTERGSATASNLFARNLGSTLGATVLGAALNVSLARSGTISTEQIRHLLDHGAAAVGGSTARAALNHSLHVTFWGVMVIALLTALATLLVPPIKLDQGLRDVS